MNPSAHKFYVYVHSRLKSGEPFYVGKGFGGRAQSYGSRRQHWNNIVAKDGGRHVNFIAKDMDEELAFLVESEIIDKYRRLGVKLVNLTDGGEGASGYVPTQQARERMSAVRKGKPAWNKGKSHTTESLAKMSASQIGHPGWNKGGKLSDEVRQKMSAGHKGQSAWNKGIPHSEEQRKKISAALIGNTYHCGKKASDETKRRQSISQTGRRHSAGTRAKISSSNIGKVMSEETILKHSLAMKGRPLSEETKRKMSETRKGRPGRPLSDEAKAKIATSRSGSKASDKTRATLRAVHLARWARIKACEVTSS